MGNTIPATPDPIFISESYQSARNVLEKIGRNIKDIASKDEIKYINFLKGNLKAAKFHHPYSQYRRYYTGSCDLDYRFHSNIWSGDNTYRHPCAGRNRNRFSYEGEAECRISKITGNKTEHGACAPYRRRQLCDYIFHQVNDNYIKTSDDLLGNVLVTAKYEGDSIVNSYANSGIWMSEWSEYFCNVLNKEIDEMNNQCKDCEMSRRCNDDSEGGKCKKCKEQCQIFKELVSKWKNQFDKQSMKYMELYNKASTNITKQNSSAPERGYRRNHRRRGYDDDTNVQLFLKKVIENNECKVESLGKYLDKTSHCGNYNFNYDNTPGSNRSNAFEITPEKFKKACKCKIPNPLEKCPNEENKNVCTRFDKVYSCTSLSFKNDLSEWNNSGVKNKENDNNGVLVPPRRRNLCINLFSKKDYKMKDENDFKEDLLNAAFSQGKLLGKKYSNYSNEAYEAMKFSYADYSDIVKGTDMMNDLKKLNKELNTLLKETEKGDISVDRKTWWDDNKNVVWNAMLCGYKTENENQQLNSSWCNVPDDDNIDQFLRWLTEWAQQYCKEKLIKAHIINTKCKDIVEGRKHKSMVDITDVECKRLFIDYEEWFRYRYNQWKGLSEKYIKIKKSKNSGVNIPSEE
ncbi:hypothetical protein PFTANZ_03630, partial [Plasmodium falciparum Tanzania (2000708)]